jgi:hypothetical protein
MASIVGGDFKTTELFPDFFSDAFNADLRKEDVQDVSDRDTAGVFQAFPIQDDVDLFSLGGMVFHDLVCMLQAAVTAVTHGHDIEMFFFSQGQVTGRRKEVCPVTEVLEGISAAAELFDVNDLHTERLEHGVCGGLILLEINRCAATAL